MIAAINMLCRGRRLWLLVACLLFCDAGLAQSSRATVRLDGNALFELSAETRPEARERADQVEARLQRILENPANIDPIAIRPAEEGGLELSTGGRPILSVSEEDALDHQAELDALAQRWQRTLDRALAQAAERRRSAWGRFKAETQASIENAFAQLLESAITVIPRVLAGLLVLLMFWALAALVRWLMRLLFARFCADPTVENLLKQVAYYSVWILGLVVATSAVGYDPQALATGLGLTGVALGFALKDILSNFVSGVLILAMRPFEIGDQIVIGETEGSVEKINLRATRIRTYDGRVVLVPNGEVFTSRVTNNTESPIRRGNVETNLSYSVDLRHATEAICEAAQNADGVLPDRPVHVQIRHLGPDGILVDTRFWTDSRRSDFLLTASHVRAAIIERLKAADIGLPDPSVRTIVEGDGRT